MHCLSNASFTSFSPSMYTTSPAFAPVFKTLAQRCCISSCSTFSLSLSSFCRNSSYFEILNLRNRQKKVIHPFGWSSISPSTIFAIISTGEQEAPYRFVCVISANQLLQTDSATTHASWAPVSHLGFIFLSAYDLSSSVCEVCTRTDSERNLCQKPTLHVIFLHAVHNFAVGVFTSRKRGACFRHFLLLVPLVFFLVPVELQILHLKFQNHLNKT
jgi:hypothetical protein